MLPAAGAAEMILPQHKSAAAFQVMAATSSGQMVQQMMQQ
jgi:hypothetical protein